jgi:arsenite methyltransferase
MTTPAEFGQVRERVRARYAQAADTVTAGGIPSCTGTCVDADEPGTGAGLYSVSEQAEVPPDAIIASLGCGNPLAIADLRAGETVLDLGSGGGIDVLLSARRVGPAGRAYGLDMTEEMLSLAGANAARAGAANVEFLPGHIEAIPLPDGSVDVIISGTIYGRTARAVPQ